MSDYIKSTNFASKDSLASGNPLKIVKGTEIDTEFNNIATAISTKTDNAAANITGGTIAGITDLAVADGGTGSSTASGARTNLGAAASGANSDITSLTALASVPSVISTYVNNRGIQSAGQLVISSSVALGSSQAGYTCLFDTSGITVTFPSSSATYILNNISSGTITLSFPTGSDFKTTLASGETVILAGDGGGYWRVVSTGFSKQRTWSNVTASRAVGTTYTNTTGREIFVSVFLDGLGWAQLEVGGVVAAKCHGDQNSRGALYGPVPAGATYKVGYFNSWTSSTLELWSELR